MGPRETAARALVAEYVWPMNPVSVATARALLTAARTLDTHPDGYYPYCGTVADVHTALAGELRRCRPVPNPLDQLRADRWARATRGEAISRAELAARTAAAEG